MKLFPTSSIIDHVERQKTSTFANNNPVGLRAGLPFCRIKWRPGRAQSQIGPSDHVNGSWAIASPIRLDLLFSLSACSWFFNCLHPGRSCSLSLSLIPFVLLYLVVAKILRRVQKLEIGRGFMKLMIRSHHPCYFTK